jgi:glycosyltransferase involved in cell wall biosynthesis
MIETDRQENSVLESFPPLDRLRVITESISLNPIGGIELCTFQDSIALSAEGHQISLFFGEDGVQRPRFEELGIRLEGPTNFEIDVYRPLTGLRRVAGPARWARTQRPDVLWLNRFEHIYWASAVAKWSQCPIVCQLHHMPSQRRLSPLHRRVAHFIAVSHFMRNEWVRAGLDPERVSVIENALPHDEYPRGGLAERTQARIELGLAPEAKIVLYYGRMMIEKGVGTLLDAWSELGLSPDEAQLVMVGSPSPFEHADFVEQLSGIDPAAVTWLPQQENVVPLLHAADVVVFPTWLEEGFGRVVIEGLSTGRPVIASRVGAVPEVLSGEMSRFLVEPRNPGDLATRIRELLNWRRDEPELEEACAQWVSTRYPYDRHLDLLYEALASHRREHRR